MEGFHKRYMNSNKVCRFWAQMASGMDIDMIVPSARPSDGRRKAVREFIQWISELQCGVDLMQTNYRVPDRGACNPGPPRYRQASSN